MPLPWQVLLPSLLSMMLVVLPQIEKIVVGIAFVVVLLTIALIATQARAHRLGLNLLVVPVLIAFLLPAATPNEHAIIAIQVALAAFVFLQVLWGLEEDTPRPWIWLAGLWCFVPSALGLAGILLLILVSNARWHAGLALARVAEQRSRVRDWAAVLMALLMLTAVALFLPFPRVSPFVTPEIPSFRFANNDTEASQSLEGTTFLSNIDQTRATGFSGELLSNSIGFTIVLGLMLAYFAYVRQKLRFMPQPNSMPQKKESLWIWLLIVGILLSLVILSLIQPSIAKTTIQLPLTSSSMAWLGILFFLALFVIARMQNKRRTNKPPSEAVAGNSVLEPLRYLLPKDAVRAAYYQWLVWLRDLELRRGVTQTPTEFSSMVHIQYPALYAETQIITEAYQRVRYGANPSQQELEAVLTALAVWQQEVATILPPTVSPQMVT